MPQNTDLILGGAGGDTVATMYPKLNTNNQSVWSWHAGSSAPTTPPTYLRWLDTTGAVKPLKINTGTPGSPVWVTVIPDVAVVGGALLPLAGGTMAGNIAFGAAYKATGLVAGTAAGDSVNKGQVDGHVMTCSVRLALPAGASTVSECILVATANFTVLDVQLLSDVATAGSSGGTRWEFQVRNVGAAGAGTTDMLATSVKTDSAEIGALNSYAVTPDQNQGMAVNEGLVLRVTKTGSPTDLSAARIVACVTYKVDAA